MELLTHHASWVMAIFVIGYLFIILEEIFNFNKASSALLMAVVCWVILFAEPDESAQKHLTALGIQMFKVSQVLFFLMGALTIVEVVNVHRGFNFITEHLNVNSKKLLLWLVGLITFFLSAVLDNLTTTVVMISLVHKLLDDLEERWLMGGAIVVAANAGGAWTPIGDVATTLLWISGQVTTIAVMRDLFLPSLLCMAVVFAWLSLSFKGKTNRKIEAELNQPEPGSSLILFLGVALLIFVPVFKVVTDLPAFMGMLLGVAILWITTDLMHHRFPERQHLRVVSILPRIDFSILYFYLGVLLAINALESSGLLRQMALWLHEHISNPQIIAISIGLLSSTVDNVSLVAACIGMFDLSPFGQDSMFWQLIAFCAGTGGSILVIGSAAGVALMALEKVGFMWYLKNIAPKAIAGYFIGILFYLFFSAPVA